MGESIKRRILAPVGLLIVTGLLANIWISVAASQFYNSMRAHTERALTTFDLARSAGRAFSAADAFVMNEVDFAVLRRPEEIQFTFAALLADLNGKIATLGDELAQQKADANYTALRRSIVRWSAEASVALGGATSSAVPTRQFLKRLSDNIKVDMSRIEGAAQDERAQLVTGERSRFARQIFFAFALVLALFAVVAVVALRQAADLARALKNLLRTMQCIGGGEHESEVPYRNQSDEVGAMARGVVQFAEGLAELTRVKEQVEQMALVDALTGLANRRQLNSHLEALMHGSAADIRPFALLHIDLDRFKQVNDYYGHAAGDKILCEAARAMRENVREQDLVARVGGDEFIIVIDLKLTGIDVDQLAQRIIDAISRPISIGSTVAQIGASIGIAFSKDANANPERVLANADLALYEAKDLGRGRYAVYSAETRNRLEQQVQLLQELKSAISNNELDTFFQPQIDGRTGELIGFETLLRWRHPRRGLLTPGDFLEVAFEHGLSDPISNIAVEKAINALQYWRSIGLDVKQVSVNLAARQLCDESFVQRLIAAVDRSPLAASNLAIEVVESVLFGDDLDPAIANLNMLRRRGFPIELDDFGTGHASISNLRRFKVNKIKIDRAFVSGVDASPEQEVMLRAIIDLAKNLGIECIAEGVESDHERAKLLALGCWQMQGYGIGPPMSLEVATRWIDVYQNGIANKRIYAIA